MAKSRSGTGFMRAPYWILTVLGVYPRRFFYPIIVVPTTIVVLTEIGFFFNPVFPEHRAVAQSVREMVSAFLPTLKGYFMLRRIHKVEAAYHFIETELTKYEKFMSPQITETVEKRAKVARKGIYRIAFLHAFLWFLAVYPQYVSYFTDPSEHRQFVINLGPEYLFMTSDRGFLTMTIVFTIHVWMSLGGNAAFDSLYIVASYVISTKAMILSTMLEDVSFAMKDKASKYTELTTGRSRETDLQSWSGSRSDEEAIYREIIRCVQYHQKICKLRDHMEEVCSLGLLLTLCSIVLTLGLAIVNIVLFAADDPGLFVLMAFVAIWTYFQLTYLCSWGDEIMEKSGDVAQAAYSAYTAGFCSKRIQQALKLMMIRAQRPLYFSAGHLLKMDYETLIAVSRKTYSVSAFALEVK